MNLKNKSKDELLKLAEATQELATRWKYNKIDTYFTDKGKNSRSNYPKQMEIMEAGKNHKIRGFIGANGSGKSIWNCYEAYCHLSGRYPEWWTGYRFDQPISAWMCAKDYKSLRDGIQKILFGKPSDIGSGIIRKEDLIDDKGNLQCWNVAGTANTIEQIRVRFHRNGQYVGWSDCTFKTYEQGWAQYQGSTMQWISLDEEPEDPKIYAECLARTRPEDGRDSGHLLATFTPTHGYTTVYTSFVPNGQFPEHGEHTSNPEKYTVKVSWMDIPHLPESWKKSQLEEWKIADPGNILARTTGEAAMGSGRVYPVDEEFSIVEQFRIPSYWPKSYAIDPGQANFAGIWMCQDPNTHVYYIYDEYKHGNVNYVIHAQAIKERGEWMHGGIDPHEAVKPRDSGETVQTYFESLGLHLTAAVGNPEALRARIRAMFDAGSLKIMNNCHGLIKEIRTLHFDEKDPNKIARGQEDHRCDAMMYCIAIFDMVCESYSNIEESKYTNTKPNIWDANEITGY